VNKLSRLALIASLCALLFPVGFSVHAAPADAPLEARAELGNSKTDMYKPIKDTKRIVRDYVQQPPLVPHDVSRYEISRNFNKCMDCHSSSRYVEMNTTRVPVTHFKSRSGQELSNLSPARYFCTQCHVPQVDTKPLVGNTFKNGQK
jgi:cytochrome c-type protein NapB